MFRFVVYLLSSQVVVTGLVVVSHAIINRTLGPEGRGDYAEITSWIAIFVAVFGLSIAPAIYHFSNETKYGYSRGELMGTILGLWGSSSVLSAIGIWAALR